jgi:hypothetical protein
MTIICYNSLSLLGGNPPPAGFPGVHRAAAILIFFFILTNCLEFALIDNYNVGHSRGGVLACNGTAGLGGAVRLAQGGMKAWQ